MVRSNPVIGVRGARLWTKMLAARSAEEIVAVADAGDSTTPLCLRDRAKVFLIYALGLRSEQTVPFLQSMRASPRTITAYRRSLAEFVMHAESPNVTDAERTVFPVRGYHSLISD